MRKSILLLFTLLNLFIIKSNSQVIDTLIDCGGYSLHFTITPGNKMPVLFESGFGNDATIWNGIKQSVNKKTGAAIITYDRQGFGQSTFNPARESIIDEVEGLELALNKLGYFNDLMLVSHSLGGFYNTVFANRNINKVKGIVFIDASIVDFYTEAELKKIGAIPFVRQIVETMKNEPSVPVEIPLIDIISGQTIKMAGRWKTCHEVFVSEAINRKIILVDKASHYIFIDDPQLVIDVITSFYVENCTTDVQKDK